MYNLIQIQDAIKGMPTQDVLKYANGQSPDVPAYLALAELNRRKQIEDTASAFYGQPQTVKQQIESSLTRPPAGQVNPTAMPQQVNPAAVPPQLAPTTQVPQQVNPAAAPAGQMNPAAAPPMMAKGGLASLPVTMFKRANYAGGGIIAFDGGGSAEEERRKQLEEERRKQMEEDRSGLTSGLKQFGAAAADILSLPGRGIAGAINTGIIRPARAITGSDIPYIYGAAPEFTESLTPFYDTFIRKPEADKVKAEKEQKDLEAFDEATKTFEEERSASGASKSPNKQASATSSGQIPTSGVAKPTFNAQAPASKDLTDEQLFERRRKLQELAGVSQDPMADIRARYAKIEERRAQQAEEDPMNALMNRFAAAATAAPEKGFGYQMAESAKSGIAFEKEQQALRDKQETSMAELQMNMAKEEDARKRGDVTAIENARAAQEKNKMDLAKLEIDRMNARANMMQAGRATTFEQQVALAKSNPELFKLIQGQGKSGAFTMEDALKSVMQDPMMGTLSMAEKVQKARELYTAMNAGQASTNAPPVGTVKDGYRFKGGNPADKNNWEKV